MTGPDTDVLVRNLAGHAIRLWLADFDARPGTRKGLEIASARLDGFCTAASVTLAALRRIDGGTPTAVLLDVMDAVRPLGDPPGADSAFGRSLWAEQAIVAVAGRWTP